ncbi:BZIP domain-containing protein [Fusarium sp. Ph1]|nr:BZIP domain-containing protein [Fusarium sp. Ph1]
MSPSNNDPETPGDADAASKRGRRPLDMPEGGSVANRRRIQNRMAQRAYRQRKESAINILKQKITELEKSKEDMGREFVNFTSVILEQDNIKNCPQIMEHIKQSTMSLFTSAGDVEDTEAGEQDGLQNEPASDLAAGGSTGSTPAIQPNHDFDFPITDGTRQIGYTNFIDPTRSNSNSNSTPSSYNVGSYFQIPTNQTPFYDMNYQLPGST